MEQRRYQRFTVSGIHGNMLFATEVNILNMSLGGCAVEADKRLNMGTEYTLRLEDEGSRITVKGVVVWSFISKSKRNRDNEVVPMYQAGIQFTDVLSDKAKDLMKFLEGHKVADEGRLSGVRFVIAADRSATLHYPFNYRVKKISMGGMLIEADQQFEMDETYPMEIYLEKDVTISFTGRIASCLMVSDREPRLFDVGIEFRQMADESRSRLKDFIETL
jgi:Tfp pilus assembly protein PilZ